MVVSDDAGRGVGARRRDGLYMSDILLAVRDLGVRRGARHVLRGVNLELMAGDRLVLEGPIGAGKTSLMLALMGLIPRAQGELTWWGSLCQREADFARIRGSVGLLFQDPDDQLIGPTVLEDVEFGPLNLGRSPAEAHALAESILERLSLEALASRPIHELSGGEKRLVALAGLLAMSPRVLLLDEPTVALDEQACARVFAVLRSLDITLLIATHDVKTVAHLATRRGVLREGELSVR